MSIKVKDADGIDRYYQTVEVGNLANPFQSVVPDFRLAHAIRQIKDVYGDDVSIWEKAKSLSKFGRNPDIDIAVKETVWNTGGIESRLKVNDIDEVVSTDALDSQSITIEGHTISGNDLTFVTQDVSLNGTTPVPLTTPLARCNRLINKSAINFAGDITVSDGAITYITVRGTEDENQSKKCATAISQSDYYMVTRLTGGIVGTISANVTFQFQIAATSGTWRTVREFSTIGFTDLNLDPCIIVPPNHDIRIIAETDTNNTEVVASIEGYLASII